MTTLNPTLDQLATSYLTRMVEPADTQAGQALALHGPVDAITALEGDKSGTAQRMAEDPFDPRKEAATMGAWEMQGIRLLTREDALWPRELNDLGSDGPIGIWYRGDAGALEAMAERTVSIVGARAATSYGEHVALEFSAALSSDHMTISGGAYGIDGAVHRGTLSAGGRTVIVSAAGIDRSYPAGHNHLFERVRDNGGLVMSEVFPGTAPTRWRFLARNRLIAALGNATIVVEAGWKSGSLNTAGHAESLGRPLGAVPGPITSATSTGCHRIIREMRGRLVTTPEEVRELTGARR